MKEPITEEEELKAAKIAFILELKWCLSIMMVCVCMECV